MKTLELTFRKNGFDYEQVSREGDIAIYKQISAGGTWFEVFVVQKNPERTIAGILIGASESVPGNEQWGKKAWTYYDLSRAREKATELQENIDRRNLTPQHTR